jgi:hypothetical protein
MRRALRAPSLAKVPRGRLCCTLATTSFSGTAFTAGFRAMNSPRMLVAAPSNTPSVTACWCARRAAGSSSAFRSFSRCEERACKVQGGGGW